MNWYEQSRVVQLIAAAPGWRVVEAIDGIPADDALTEPLDHLFRVEPVACLAIVEHWESVTAGMEVEPNPEHSRHFRQGIEPVVRCENWFEPIENALCLLAPGEDLDESWRDEALHNVRRRRAPERTDAR